MLRILLSAGNILVSLIIGAFLMALVAVYSPGTLSVLLGWARGFKSLITGTGLDAKYNIWLEVLLDERQLLFIGFTVVARVLIGLIAYPIVQWRLRSSGRGFYG